MTLSLWHHSSTNHSLTLSSPFLQFSVVWLSGYPGAIPGCGDDAARHSVRESELPVDMARPVACRIVKAALVVRHWSLDALRQFRPVSEGII